jgi:hypothetical protein
MTAEQAAEVGDGVAVVVVAVAIQGGPGLRVRRL